MSNERDGKSLTPSAQSSVPTVVPLGQMAQLDLSYLSEEERKALLMDHSRGLLDINRRAQGIGVDVMALNGTLNTLTDSTRQASKDGNSVTITHTQESQIGRTEIIMGNTETAGKGKLSKSQTGERNWTPIYVLAGLVALVLIAIAIGGR